MSKVVIAVFDGLQLSQISPTVTPNIYGVGLKGCIFENHHPVFPSVTRINAASMTTGVYPGTHGLAGNTFVARDWDQGRVIPALEFELSKMLAGGTDPLLTDSLQLMISDFGKEYFAIGVGTSGNAYVHNYMASSLGGGTIHPDFSIPNELNRDYLKRFGAWPAQKLPNTLRYKHAMRIFIDSILEEENPDVALIWSSEPDKSQHAYGVGHPLSDKALSEADQEFGKLLGYIESRPDKSDIDIMILSDHGYSTVMGKIDVKKEMEDAGFNDDLSEGRILLAPNGGSVLIYLNDLEEVSVDKLVSWMMSQDWCGAILATEKLSHLEGTLPASIIGNDGIRGADLTMSFKWSDENNEHGYKGQVFSTDGEVGVGQHGSMSKYEMNNLLICYGKSFREGERILSPTGNVDILPTVLKLLDVPIPETVEGRVLNEALLENGEKIVSTLMTHTASRSLAEGQYIQQLSVSNVNGTLYLEQGNAL